MNAFDITPEPFLSPNWENVVGICRSEIVGGARRGLCASRVWRRAEDQARRRVMAFVSGQRLRSLPMGWEREEAGTRGRFSLRPDVEDTVIALKA